MFATAAAEPSQDIPVALISAAAVIAVAVVGAVAARFATNRSRKRVLFSEAVRAAVRWKEMVYRVRRRGRGDVDTLVALHNDIQDDLTYYRAWIGSESAAMQRSYDTLVASIKARTSPLITAAWAAPVRPRPGNAKPDDVHPDIEPAVDRFMRDVRAHLSPLVLPRICVHVRNRKPK